MNRRSGAKAPKASRVEEAWLAVEGGSSSAHLEASLVKFVCMLRNLGMPVSTSEAMDALNALFLVDLGSREEVKASLRATLVKNGDYHGLFERAFDLFFVPPETKARRKRAWERRQRKRELMLKQAEAELTFQGQPIELSEVQKETYARLIPADRQKIQEFLDKSSQGIKVDHKFKPIIETIVKGHLDRWRKQLGEEQRPDLEVSMTGEPELDCIMDELASGAGSGREPNLFEDLKNVTEKDLPRVAVLTLELARRLATRISRRYKITRKRERVDLRRTIRSSIRFGGTPIVLRYKARKVQKPRILLICDVSGSMARYTGFLLQFVYGMASVMGRIESFVFSEDLHRVTPYFQQQRPFQETMTEVVNRSGQWGRGTNLSIALRTFNRCYRHLLTPDTFVIILSDTKTLEWEEAGKGLKQMREKVKDILWLNTLPRLEWEKYPAVAAFARYSRMFECYTLAHLESILRNELWR